MDLASDYESYHVAYVRNYDRNASPICLVTKVGKSEDDHQGQRCANGCERICGYTIKP